MPDVALQGLRSVSFGTSGPDIAQILAEDGAVIVREVFTADQIAQFRAETDEALATRPLGPMPGHTAGFWGVNTRQLHDLFTRSTTFREQIIENDFFHEVGDAVFGSQRHGYSLVDCDIIDVGPGSAPQTLHRDLERYDPFIGLGSAAEEIMVTFMVAVTRFTKVNGGTRVALGSGAWPDYTDRGTEDQCVSAEMNPGDVLVFSGKASHGTGGNVTEDERRLGLSIGLQVGYLKPKANWPFLVDRGLAEGLSPRVRQLLGFPSLS